jgi:hypothetical protein
LVVWQARSAEVPPGRLKAALGRSEPVAVSEKGTDSVVSIDYDTEDEARDALPQAQAAAPNAQCYVEEYPLEDRLTADR